MAILSSAVSPGDDILAAHYNNLRTDLLTGDVTIAGIKTFSSASVFSEGHKITATKKLILDGGGDDDTYFVEGAEDDVDFYVGGSICVTFRTANLDIKQDTYLAATKKLYFDGGGDLDTYIEEGSEDDVDMVVGGTSVLTLQPSVFYVKQDMKITATKKLYLDGTAGNNTYIVESSGDVMDFYTGGTNALKISAAQDITIPAGELNISNGAGGDGIKLHNTYGGGYYWNIKPQANGDNLEFYYDTTLRYYFDEFGSAHSDVDWDTFSPDINKDLKRKKITDQDYLLWALQDAEKPVKPYEGLPRLRRDKDDKHPSAFGTKEEVKSEIKKYSKSPAKIAIGIANWAKKAEERLKALEAKL